MSKEHVIPDWLRKVIPRIEDSFTLTGLGWRPQPGYVVHLDVFDPKQKRQHVGTLKVRNVCTRCNNGWMKAIQDAAIPILKPLLQGVWEDLSPEDGRIIHDWLSMIVANISQTHAPPAGVTDDDRTALYNTKHAPPGWLSFVGRLTGGPGYAIRQRPVAMGSHSLGIPPAPDGNGQITTLQLGQLVLQSVHIPPWAMHIDPFAYGGSSGIFPVFPWGEPRLDWRTAPFLTRADVNEIAHRIAHILMSSQLRR